MAEDNKKEDKPKDSLGDRMDFPLGIRPDGEPWKEEDFPWELDENNRLVLKKKPPKK